MSILPFKNLDTHHLEQLEIIAGFLSSRDVFAVLPTGFRKTLCYMCLPLVFNSMGPLCDTQPSIVLIIAPFTYRRNTQPITQKRKYNDTATAQLQKDVSEIIGLKCTCGGFITFQVKHHLLSKGFCFCPANIFKPGACQPKASACLVSKKIAFVHNTGMCMCVSTPKAINYIHMIFNLYNQLNNFVTFRNVTKQFIV